eukprot:8351038-Alexandrium_andersonii.AAC.2
MAGCTVNATTFGNDACSRHHAAPSAPTAHPEHTLTAPADSAQAPTAHNTYKHRKHVRSRANRSGSHKKRLNDSI